MRIFLDIDDVIGNFQEHFSNHFNVPLQKSWVTSNLMKNRLGIIKNDKNFWLSMPIKNKPNFIPKGFVSARGINLSWTKEFLKINKIQGRTNVHHVNWGESKISILKQLNADIFIDDNYKTFKECNRSGIFCLLMDSEHNQKYKTKLRIFDLDINIIMELYRKYYKIC
jgi:uncharacterized HAD superfamily protein